MMYKKFIMISLCLFILITSCGGSGGGGSASSNGAGNGSKNPLFLDLSGGWTITNISSGTCDLALFPMNTNDFLYVTHDESSFAVVFYSTCSVVNGAVSGQTVSWSGTMPDGSGIVNIDFTGTVNADASVISGTATVLLTNGVETCQETFAVEARIASQVDVNIAGSWSGNWNSSVRNADGTFTAQLSQNNGTLSGIVDIPGINIFGATLEGAVAGNNAMFGNVRNKINFCGELDVNGVLVGTYSNPTINDRGDWEAGTL